MGLVPRDPSSATRASRGTPLPAPTERLWWARGAVPAPPPAARRRDLRIQRGRIRPPLGPIPSSSRATYQPRAVPERDGRHRVFIYRPSRRRAADGDVSPARARSLRHRSRRGFFPESQVAFAGRRLRACSGIQPHLEGTHLGFPPSPPLQPQPGAREKHRSLRICRCHGQADPTRAWEEGLFP